MSRTTNIPFGPKRIPMDVQQAIDAATANITVSQASSGTGTGAGLPPVGDEGDLLTTLDTGEWGAAPPPVSLPPVGAEGDFLATNADGEWAAETLLLGDPLLPNGAIAVNDDTAPYGLSFIDLTIGGVGTGMGAYVTDVDGDIVTVLTLGNRDMICSNYTGHYVGVGDLVAVVKQRSDEPGEFEGLVVSIAERSGGYIEPIWGPFYNIWEGTGFNTLTSMPATSAYMNTYVSVGVLREYEAFVGYANATVGRFAGLTTGDYITLSPPGGVVNGYFYGVAGGRIYCVVVSGTSASLYEWIRSGMSGSWLWVSTATGTSTDSGVLTSSNMGLTADGHVMASWNGPTGNQNRAATFSKTTGAGTIFDLTSTGTSQRTILSGNGHAWNVNIGSTTQSGTAKYYYFTLSAMTATSVSTSTRVGGTTGAGLAIDTLTIDESTGDLLFFEGSTNGATPFPTGPASNVPTGIIYRLTPGGSLTSAALVPTARINSWFSTTYYKTIGQCTWSDGELYIGLGRIDPAGTFSSWLIKTDTVGSWTDVIVGNDSNAVTKYFFGKPIISTDGSEVYVQRGTNLTSSSISVYSNVFHGTTTG